MRFFRAVCAAAFAWLSLCCAVKAQMFQQEPGIPGCGWGVPTTTLGSMGIPNGCAPGVPSLPVSSSGNCSFLLAASGSYLLTNTGSRFLISPCNSNFLLADTGSYLLADINVRILTQ